MKLPIWARSVLAIAPLRDRRAEVERDLAELFADCLDRYGRLYAHRRLGSDVVSLWRGTSRGGTVLQDLRFAVRLFRRHPAPVGIAIGGLALAIGVVATVFTIVDAAMLRPYGMDDPASVVSVGDARHGGRPYWSYATFLRLHQETSLARVEAAMAGQVRFSTGPAGDGAVNQQIRFVSGGYLQTLGGRPTLGRSLDPADDLAGAPPVIVVSDHFFTAQLNGDPAAVGKTVWLNGAAVTVVGVLRPDFTGPVKVRPSIWAPFATFDEVRGGPPFGAGTGTRVEVVARLAPGVAASTAQENLSAIVTRSMPSGSSPAAASVPPVLVFSAASPIANTRGTDAAEAFSVLAAITVVIGLVLAVACANTANLLLAAATTRMPEMGVRLALGASTRRLVRQMVSESLLLGVAAGGLGFLFAFWLVPIFSTMLELELSPDFSAAPDARALLFTVVVALLCGLGAGLSPARYGARGNVLAALKSQTASHPSGGAAPSRLRTSFVAFQAAASMLLLVMAALLFRTATVMTRAGVGFDADRLLAVSIEPLRSGFDEPGYLTAALAAVRGVASVERASVTRHAPFSAGDRDDLSVGGQSFQLNVHHTDADFFSTTGARIVRGRAFTADEVAQEAPVALVSDSVARAFFPGADPIGKSLAAVPSERGRQDAVTVIGVVADAMLAPIWTQGFGAIYRPINPRQPGPPNVFTDQGFPYAASIVVRTANPGRTGRAVQEALERLDPKVRATSEMVSEHLDGFLGGKRMLAWVFAPTAILAVLLAMLGVFGVTAFVVGQRTKEVSLRLAIGASSADVGRLLVRDSLRPVLVGLGAGLGLALVVGRVLASNLAGISPHDPMSILVATVTLLAGAMLAVVIPARRIARTDPASVLRQV